MGFIMQKQFHFLSPVEVVKVTSQNLDEVAEWCGGSVQETESRRRPGTMDKYVLVPTPKGTNISWAFPGMFITKRLVITVKDELRATYAVFRRDYFEKNYFSTPKEAADKTWEREASEKAKPVVQEINVTVNVGEALIEAQRKLKKAHDKLVEAGVDAEDLEPIEEVKEVVQEAIAEAIEEAGEVQPDTGVVCYWKEPHILEPDGRLPEGCGWRTLHNWQPTELAVDAAL